MVNNIKQNINDVKQATTLELIENTWDSFLNLIKTNCKNCDCNMRPHSYIYHLQQEQYILVSAYLLILSTYTSQQINGSTCTQINCSTCTQMSFIPTFIKTYCQHFTSQQSQPSPMVTPPISII